MIWAMYKPDGFLFAGACLEPEIEFEICSGSKSKPVRFKSQPVNTAVRTSTV